jgi:uncharacterized protein YcaQ
MDAIEIEKAKDTLRKAGYYVDNLWQVDDVIGRYDCKEDDAQDILNDALQNESVMASVWECIDYYAKKMNLKETLINQYNNSNDN